MTSFISPHCISAYIVRQTSTGPLYLLIRRCGKYLPGTWQMVTGGILDGETAVQAAIREIHEETGLTPIQLYSADAVETFYMPSLDKITFVPVFIAFVKEMDVKLSPSEHDAYEWLTFEEAKKRLVWSEQQRVITQIHETCVLQKPNELLLIEEPIASRTGVYGVAMQNQQLLLVKQFQGPHRGKWDLPGGGIEAGETIEEALQRELREEVAMTFASMTFFANFTAVTKKAFHQIGLVYLIDELSSLIPQGSEMEYAWIDPNQLSANIISPFVAQTLSRLKTLSPV